MIDYSNIYPSASNPSKSAGPTLITVLLCRNEVA